jgi:hypothetical protein
MQPTILADIDTAMQTAARKDRDEWNRKNPDNAIVVTVAQLKSGATNRTLMSPQRLRKNAPRNARGRVNDGLGGQARGPPGYGIGRKSSLSPVTSVAPTD